MNKLLSAGRLTGAEYYSASKNKTEIIKGLENKEAYFDNLKRFGALIDNQEDISAHFDSIKDTVKKLQNDYYNRQQKKIEELSAKYVSGNIEPKKYFILMNKYAEKLAVDIDNYPNLALYIEMLKRQKEIDYEKTTKQLQAFVLRLKEVLPYNAYKMLLDGTKNFSQMDKLYGYLIKLSGDYSFDLSRNFSELEKFFAYIELSQRINPLELIVEEQNFRAIFGIVFYELLKLTESLGPSFRLFIGRRKVVQGVVEVFQLFFGVGVFLARHPEREFSFKQFFNQKSFPDTPSAVNSDELRFFTCQILFQLDNLLFTTDDVLFHTQEFWRKDTKNMRLRQPCGRILAQSRFFYEITPRNSFLQKGDDLSQK